MKTKLKFILALSLITTVHAFGDDAATKVENLGKMSYEEASGTANSIISQNHELIATLVGQIRQKDFPPDSKVCAIYILGQLRPKDMSAIQVLLDNIDFVASHQDLQLSITRWGIYPAQEALIKIGNPSIPAVIRNLAESDDTKIRELSLQVLYRIDGDKDISELRLQKALKAETNSQKQARLQAALKSLSELK